MSLLEIVLSFGMLLLVATGTAVVRARRMARILDIDPASRRAQERVPPPPIAPLLDVPDVAAPLLAPVEPRPALLALARDPRLDLPALLEALRQEFERQARGEPLVHLIRSEAASLGLDHRPVARAVLATAEPVLGSAYADERFTTCQVRFTALCERADRQEPLAWTEVWGLRRPTAGGPWELLQILSCDVRAAEPPPEGGARLARYAPWPPPGDADVAREHLDRILADVLAGLSGRPPGLDRITPVLRADLAFRAASVGAFAEWTGEIDAIRPGAARREGSNLVAAVAVDGRITHPEAWHFREVWQLVRPFDDPTAAWRLWRADPIR